MSAAAVEYDWSWDALLRAWQELDVPEGWHAEILEGGITMTPPPGNGHNRIAERVHRALIGVLPSEWGVYQTLAVSVTSLRRLFEPDLVVVPETELSALPDAMPVPADRAKLAVEIVSKSNARTDRVEKLRAYALAPVPLYLLIDRFAEAGPLVTLFSDPADGHYQSSHGVPFGGKITIPEPIGLVLDTKEFD
ncbi:Uma2 family endonuclease [Amycolatopsis sp. NPDC059021]|uniref:Uma2 family endonuclease n=1 Tax=Amycolatopsis sp. NPDC059021 TaxID=3346704 RepID=UPI00366D9497